MFRPLLALLGLSAVATLAIAIPNGLFSDVETYLRTAEDLVVAEVVRPVKIPENVQVGGLHFAEVDILLALKGDEQPGRRRIASLAPVQAGRRYLLMSTGGRILDTDFIAKDQLSVVEVPDWVTVDQLRAMDAEQQVRSIFKARQQQLEMKLARLKEEQRLLEKAIGAKTE